MAHLALAAVAVAALVMLATAPSLAPADLRVLCVPLAVATSHAALAYAAGRLAPAVLTIPLAALGSWFLIAYSIAIEPLWVQRLGGNSSTAATWPASRPARPCWHPR